MRAPLLQVLCAVRSERLLMEQLEYNLLFRWFVGLNMDEPVWVPTVFNKNRDRLLEGDIANKVFDGVLKQARETNLVSNEHFGVDGTLIEAWASRPPAFLFNPTDLLNFYRLVFLRRSAFMITETELKVIAALAIMGLSSNPKKG